MEINKEKYYVIREDVLPEAILKALDMKRALIDNPKLSITEVSRQFSLSRSAFYKYKDTVFPLQDIKKESTVSMSIDVNDIPGVLGKILNIVNSRGCNVLTIHQTVPINNKATIICSLSIDLKYITIEKLKFEIENIEDVNKIIILGMSLI